MKDLIKIARKETLIKYLEDNLRQYLTREEWQKFEANMSPDKKYLKNAEEGGINEDSWGQLQGLERFRRNNAHQYINDAFPWDETPEGRNYWLDLQEIIYKREIGFIK